jgi:hypothetical protein
MRMEEGGRRSGISTQQPICQSALDALQSVRHDLARPHYENTSFRSDSE